MFPEMTRKEVLDSFESLYEPVLPMYDTMGCSDQIPTMAFR